MSFRDDFPGDMPRFPFDDRDADAVFGTSSGPDSVPEDLRDVAELVSAARRAGSADELIGEDVIVAQIAASVGEHVSSLQSDAHERISVLSKLRTAKLAAATTALVVLGATAAAAATGTLPSPAHSQAKLTVARAAGATIPTSSPENAEHQAEHHGRHHHKHMKHALVGTVAAINGVSDPNTCGTTGGEGSFTITRHDTTYIVNVDTSTAFRDEAVTDPSFANVCVGGLVAAKGTVNDTTVDAKKVIVIPPRERKGAFGLVASVNGVSDPNTCGTAGAAGSFTLTGHEGSEPFTVNVDPATEYLAKDGIDTSFANVCVGLAVGAKGDLTDQVVTATKVFIAPMLVDDPGDNSGDNSGDVRHEHVFGVVASVNGVSDPNSCGTDGAAGSFTITSWKGETFTVNVDATTQFFGDSDPSFADVCVGSKVGAKGDVTDSTVAATDVFALRSHDSETDGRHHRGDCDKNGWNGDPNVRGVKSWHDGDRHGDNNDSGFALTGSRHGGHDHSDWSGTHHRNDS